MGRFRIFRIILPFVRCLDLVLLSVLSILRKVNGIDESLPLYVVHSLDRRRLHGWKIRVWYPLLRIDVSFKKNVVSHLPIDVVIPTIEKDFNTLLSVVDAAKANIKHPIRNFFVISNESKGIIEFCKDNGLKYIFENDLMGYSKERIDYWFDGHSRAGWLYQQLLKLNSDAVAECDDFLILDSDTVFLRPKVFSFEGKTIFDQSDEMHTPYFKAMNALLGTNIHPDASFIVHYMLFNKTVLRELKGYISNKNNMRWDDAIIRHTDYSSNSGFSEYETYANYFSLTRRSKMIVNYWFNTTIQPKGATYFKSYSNHNYCPEESFQKT